MASKIKCCRHCVPPKRYPGCGANCEEYKKEKEESKRENEWLKDCDERISDIVRTSRGIPINKKRRPKKE